MWLDARLPLVEAFSLPGLSFANFTRSSSVLNWESAFTRTTEVSVTWLQMGAKLSTVYVARPSEMVALKLGRLMKPSV